MWYKNVIFLFSFIVFFSCENAQEDILESPHPNATIEIKPTPKKPVSLGQFPRDNIKDRLASKIEEKEDLFVHVFVPLCDNEHQGIVPVNKTLGDGFNPRSNLYWGALYGIKTHFKKHRDWELIHAEKDVKEEIILERAVFQKQQNGQNIYLIADAYRGDKMKYCLLDYMNSISGNTKENISIDNKNISIYGNADLMVFNGHNGLMDMTIPFIENKDGIQKDAIAIACASHGYFTSQLEYAGGYPILMTTNLLAPEAYVLENVISEWANGSNGTLVADAAGTAYNEYQNCGYKGARRLFKSGW